MNNETTNAKQKKKWERGVDSGTITIIYSSFFSKKKIQTWQKKPLSTQNKTAESNAIG